MYTEIDRMRGPPTSKPRTISRIRRSWNFADGCRRSAAGRILRASHRQKRPNVSSPKRWLGIWDRRVCMLPTSSSMA